MALVQIQFGKRRIIGIITGKVDGYYVVESGDKRLLRHRDLIKPLDDVAVSMLG